MRAFISIVVAGIVVLPAASGPVSAKGCIKGAIVGGVAGHYAGHHAFLGAAAGCVAGRHMANRPQSAPTTGQGADSPKQINKRDTNGLSREDLNNPP
jgi:hypothetical protein